MPIKAEQSKSQKIPACANTTAGKPKLRFPGFSGGWMEKKLGEVGENIIGLTYSPNNIVRDGGTLVLRSSNIKDESLYLTDQVRVNVCIAEKLKVKDNDILICTRNGSQRLIGKNLLLKKQDETVTYGAFMSVYRSPFNDFFVHLFKTDKYKKQVHRNLGARINQITTGYLNKFKFYIPQKEEQHKIAGFLGATDGWIENLRAQKENLESYKKGMMQKIFSQEVRFKDDKGNDFAEWEEKRLGEVFTSERGKGLSKEKISIDGKNKCILYGELYTTYAEVVFNIKSSTNNKEGLKSKIGDLLIPSSTTTTGIDLANITALNKNDVLLGGDIIVLRAKSQISNIFYAYYLSNYKKTEIARYAQGVTIIHLYFSHIKKMNIDLPSFLEQQKIANFLTSLDNLIESKQKQITQAEQWKKGLMQGLFT